MSNCYFDGQFGVYPSSYSLNSSSYFLLTYSSCYVLFLSNLFKSPKFGPKNPWEFWNPETQKYTVKSEKSPPNGSDQVNLSPSMQVSGPGNTERGRWKKLVFFLGLRNIPFYWGKSVNPSFSWKFVEFTPDESEGKKDGIHHLWWFSLKKKHGLNPMVSSNLMVAITAMLRLYWKTCKSM